MTLFNTEMNSKFVHCELNITLFMRLHAQSWPLMYFQRFNLVVHQLSMRMFMLIERKLKKIITILILAPFSGKGRHTPHYVL